MQQAVHIFKKDVRYLRHEICLVLTLNAIFALMGSLWVEFLMTLAAAYLIARVVHAEAIPGENQFWITRPYRWRSLLAAKVVFILAFVNLPICLAQAAIIFTARFPPGAVLAGLMWSQVLLLVLLSVPVAALAAMTSGILPFMLATFVLLTIGFSVFETVVRTGIPWPEAFEWVRDYAAGILVVGMTLAVLYLQYRHRRTFLSRTLAAVCLTLAAVGYWFMPLPLAFAVQAKLSKQKFDGSSLYFSLTPASKKPLHKWNIARVPVQLPIDVHGVPDGITVRADAFSITVQEPGGRIWEPDLRHPSVVSRQSSAPGKVTFHTTVFIDRAFFDQVREKSVNLRTSLFLTAFGNPRSRTIPLQEKPTNALDGLQCYLGAFDHMTCRSAFRWPKGLVYSRNGTDLSSLTQIISYSPFPARMTLNPIETRWATGSVSAANELTIIVNEALAHFRRDFDVNGVNLADFTSPGGL
jgi:hypothetical protein